MARPTKGVEHVDALAGSAESRRRLKLVLETIAGERTVESACVELAISPARFAQIREEALCGALLALEPRAPGRPAAPVPDPEVARLRAENRELRRELEASRIREEIAIVMPHVLQPPPGQKGGSKARRRGGKGGT